MELENLKLKEIIPDEIDCRLCIGYDPDNPDLCDKISALAESQEPKLRDCMEDPVVYVEDDEE